MYLLILVFPLITLILSLLHSRGVFKEPGSGGYTSKAARQSAQSWAYTQAVAPGVLRKWGLVFLGVGVAYILAALWFRFPSSFANVAAAIVVMSAASYGSVYLDMEHRLRIFNQTQPEEGPG